MEENKNTAIFLGRRMKELREKNHCTLDDMVQKLYNGHGDKASLSKVESGKYTIKGTVAKAKEYCAAFGMTEEQTNNFLRGEKVVVVDTSALLKKVQLIDELSKEYSRVIVPNIVIDELDNIKDTNKHGLASKAWLIMQDAKSKAITRNYEGPEDEINDKKIIAVARAASLEFNCEVDIITYDSGFAARLNDDDTVHALFLEDYIATKQSLLDMNTLKKIDEYFADNYEDIEKVLNVTIPNKEDINAYLSNGFTLIISTVRNRSASLEQRKAKIKWLIEHNADVNKRDSAKHYLPPLSHAVQKNDFEIFKFLLHDCQANPNVGSRNPYDSGKIQQRREKNEKNDGNMPLMIASWDNKIEFVKELCEDPRISINQQDGNGFTALIKACYWGWLECRDILLQYGADERIVDRNGYTAEDRYNEYLETGRRKNSGYGKKKTGGYYRK